MSIIAFILVVVGCFIYFSLEAAGKKIKETSNKLDDLWDQFCASSIVRGFFILCIVFGVGLLYIIAKGF